MHDFNYIFFNKMVVIELVRFWYLLSVVKLLAGIFVNNYFVIENNNLILTKTFMYNNIDWGSFYHSTIDVNKKILFNPCIHSNPFSLTYDCSKYEDTDEVAYDCEDISETLKVFIRFHYESMLDSYLLLILGTPYW